MKTLLIVFLVLASAMALSVIVYVIVDMAKTAREERKHTD